MNTLQLTPLGVKSTPPGPTGVSPVGEALPTPAPNSQPNVAQQRLAEARANTARAAAERKARAAEAADAPAAPEAPAPVDTFDRKIGLVDGTFKVFIDIVKPPGDQPVARVFGPSDNAPSPQPRTSASASYAYSRAVANLPLKDLGIA